MTFPDEAAAIAFAEFKAAQRRNPALVAQVGPQDTLNRYLAGDVITFEDYVTDQSPFTIKAMLPVQVKRLKWMLDNLK